MINLGSTHYLAMNWADAPADATHVARALMRWYKIDGTSVHMWSPRDGWMATGESRALMVAQLEARP